MEKITFSGFRNLPKTRLPWWALILAACAFLGNLFLQYAYVIWPSFGNGGYTIDPVHIAVILLILATISIERDCLALKKGDRSWVVWLGLILAVYVGAVWVIKFTMLLIGMLGG